MRFVFFLLLAVFLSVLIISACAEDMPEGERIATGPCVQCHSNLITCENLDEDLIYWEQTVQRMVDKGMDISEEQQREVSVYLSELEPGAEPICD